MAHEITTHQNGRAEMAFVGEAAWHGLGQELQAGASIEEWKKAAGMDWTVMRSKVRYATDREGSILEFPEQIVQFRSDTKAPLGIVSSNFKTVQPGEALEFFRDLSEFPLSVAGTLKGGKKYWATAKIATDTVLGGDKVDGYLLFATACDGSMRTTVKVCPTRVVCANTLAMAMNETNRHIVEVSHRSKFDASAVKAQLGIVGGSMFEKFMRDARAMANREVSEDDSRAFVEKLLGIDSTKQDDAPEAYNKILGLYNGEGMGSKMLGSEGTTWGLLNAVTEYADHHIRARSDDNRLDSAWFGMGMRLKNDALVMAQEMIA